jgi:DNA-directed RNA polymerase specialized sigma24 family protein
VIRRNAREEYPFRSESDWLRHERRHRSLPLAESLRGLSSREADYLSTTELRELLDSLHLDAFERCVAGLRLSGHTIREIAALAGVPKCRVEGALRRVRRRVRAWQCGALRSGTTGWQEVYLSEVRRRGCRRAADESS